MRTRWFMAVAAIGLCVSIGFTPLVFAQAKAANFHLPPFSKFQLDNGMTVLLMEQHEVPIVSFSFVLKTGATADPKGKEGLASLTASMLRKGTQYWTAEEAAERLDSLGGQFDMAASLDFSGGSAEFLKKDLDKGLEIVANLIIDSTFAADNLDKVKAQQIDGIKAAKDRVANVINRYFNAFLFGDHPYGRPIGGTETSLAGITRNDLLGFYRTYYTPSNFILAAAGDFNSSEMRKTIEQRFQRWPAKAAPVIALDAPHVSAEKRVLVVDKPDATQTYFYIGGPGIARNNPDRVAITVVNTLLGGRFTSRLNSALRIETGLTYGANSRFDETKLPGSFAISSYTRNATTYEALDKALDVLRTLHEKGVTETELASVQAYLIGQFPPSLETTDRLAAMLTRLEFYGLSESDVNDYTGKVSAVTTAEAARVIGRYFPKENLTFVLIGKAAEIGPGAQKYGAEIVTREIAEPGF